MSKKYVKDQALRVLYDKLEKQAEELSGHVSEGGCKDYAEYAHMTGVIEGLGRATRSLIDLDETMDQD